MMIDARFFGFLAIAVAIVGAYLWLKPRKGAKGGGARKSFMPPR